MFEQLKNKANHILASNVWKHFIKWAKRFFFIATFAYLLIQLQAIGFREVIAALPTTPWFYIILLLLYFALPVSELFIYRASISFSFRQAFPVFLKKKILNRSVLGYSGEIYLYLWFKENTRGSSSDLLKLIKDNNVISSITSTLLSAIFLTFFLYSGQVKIENPFEFKNKLVFFGLAAAVALVGPLLIILRKHIISMPAKMAWSISLIHFARLVLVHVLQIVQWVVVMPEIPLYVWFTYISVLIVVARIPFLPNNDLLFAVVSIEMSNTFNIASAGIAGLFIAHNEISRLLNVIVYGLSSHRPGRKQETNERPTLNAPLSSPVEP